MDESTLTFLRRVYRGHYFKHHDLVEIPSQIQAREFGYIPFGGGMIRHLSFKNRGELVAELVKQAPSSVYCSNATYERPTLQMDEKGWLGADLIFDIDADSIPTPCKAKHKWWRCTACKKGGMGAKPSKCPRCRSSALEQVQWSCEECLNATKEHVKRLTDFLMADFGVSQQRIRLYFSGNRGYHAHVQDERFAKADPQMRAEVANYIRGIGLSLRFAPQDNKAADAENSMGWRRRSDLFMMTTTSTYGKRQAQKLTDQIVVVNAALIDESVTTDIHRVFRMPGTLHGNSGLLKMRVESIDDFDPEKDPVVLSDEKVKVHVDFSPGFSLNGVKFGPYDSSTVQIPIYAAVFLTARGLGEVLAG
jgi:DNA primase small subunit